MTVTVRLDGNRATCEIYICDLKSCLMKNPRLFYIILSALLLLASPSDSYGKKIKQFLKVKTERSNKITNNKLEISTGNLIAVDVCGLDSATFMKDSVLYSINLSSIKFAGYDKALTSAKESFHTINETPYDIMGMTLRIVYKDMKGRMLHSREVTIEKKIPHDETRKIDIPSWDSQKSFYYYMSNKPKRVAAPYKVTITPLSLIINY